MRRFMLLNLMALGTILFFGCGPRQTPAAPQVLDAPETLQSEADLVDQWRSVLVNEFEDMNIGLAMEVTARLAARGPEALEPIFEILADAEEGPVAKMLAVISLSPHITERHLDRLIALTDGAHDQSTRGCATHLLSRLPDQQAEDRIRELFSDPDKHVSKVATLVLLRQKDAAAVERAIELWNDPETGENDRNELILAFPSARAADNMALYEDALCREGMDYPARAHAINIIGILGDLESLEKIEPCLESEEDPELLAFFDAAKAAVIARHRAQP